MIKKEIYPKTKRVKCSGVSVQVTEKLDGSNLCIFKKNDKLYIAQRKTILCIDEIEENKDVMYKGLYQWLMDNKEELNDIRNDAVLCGEWLGMGRLKYTVDEFDKRFYMFAKANIDIEFCLYNIYYDHDLFKYPFESLEIPKCIGVVPVAYDLEYIPDKDKLDILYTRYTDKVKRNVEGFVVNVNNNITKYVRMKNGQLQEHFDRGNKTMLQKLKDILNTYSDSELKDMGFWINDTIEPRYILVDSDNITLITVGTELKVNGYIEQEGRNER